MADKMMGNISSYIIQTITGFESGLYKTIEKMEKNEKLAYLSDKHQPFITIFRDLHEDHFTRTFKLIFDTVIDTSENPIVKFFSDLSIISNHSKICLLNIIANLTVSVHFNIDRKKLNIKNYTAYIKSLVEEIKRTIPITELSKLFDHICIEPSDAEIIELKKREKFINIELSHISNGVKKTINSHDIKL